MPLAPPLSPEARCFDGPRRWSLEPIDPSPFPATPWPLSLLFVRDRLDGRRLRAACEPPASRLRAASARRGDAMPSCRRGTMGPGPWVPGCALWTLEAPGSRHVGKTRPSTTEPYPVLVGSCQVTPPHAHSLTAVPKRRYSPPYCGFSLPWVCPLPCRLAASLPACKSRPGPVRPVPGLIRPQSTIPTIRSR